MTTSSRTHSEAYIPPLLLCAASFWIVFLFSFNMAGKDDATTIRVLNYLSGTGWVGVATSIVWMLFIRVRPQAYPQTEE